MLLDAFAEQFVGAIRLECPDRLLIFGRGHLEQVLAEYIAHYNGQRLHRALDQQVPQSMRVAPVRNEDPMCLRRHGILGGLIN